MTASPKLKNLELSVTNFGPIARAGIDLRPLTVFVGPSNTGKSYLAVLIYALHSFFGGKATALGLDFETRGRSIFGSDLFVPDDTEISENDLEALDGWMRTLRTRGELAHVLPEPVARLVRQRLRDVEDLDEEFDFAVSRCFGIHDARLLIRSGIKDTMRVGVGRSLSEEGAIQYEYTRKGDAFGLMSLVQDEASPQVAVNASRARYFRSRLSMVGTLMSVSPNSRGRRERTYLADDMLGFLADEYGSATLSPLTATPYYLPADRTGIMHAHRVVVSSLIERAPRAALSPERPLPVLSGVLADFLQTLISLRESPRSRSRAREDLAIPLETNVLGGAIRYSESVTGYPEFSYRPDGWHRDLPLMNTSSMVSELAPVALYLRHIVRPGDLLIIEEPESHLHPAMQVEFTRQLAGIVRAGIRVLLTTHSEWVLDELANLVRLSDTPESKREGIGGRDYALGREQVGVWLFEPRQRPRGSVVKEIPFDEDFGGFRSGFDEVAIDTYNDYAVISNRIEEARAEYGAR